MEKLAAIVPGCMAMIVNTKYKENVNLIGKVVQVLSEQYVNSVKAWSCKGEGLIHVFVNCETKIPRFVPSERAYISEENLMRIDGFDQDSDAVDNTQNLTSKAHQDE